MGSETSLACRDLSFSVAAVPLLGPVTLSLRRGEVTALIGQNGSGKSTLLRLLAGQERPGAGNLCLGGRPLRDWPARERARQIGYLPQSLPSTGGLLLRELVAQGRYPWHGALGIFGRTDREATQAALSLTGLADHTGRDVDTLSGGERQRAWLAMLLAQRAGWLLLDEPISALDVLHQVEVMGLIRGLSRSQGLGVLVVLHDINLAARFCDRIIALRSGRVVADGAPDVVVEPQTLERIYGLPMLTCDSPCGRIALPGRSAAERSVPSVEQARRAGSPGG